MKKYLIIQIVILMFFPCISSAEDFLGAPLIPDAQIVDKTDSHIELSTDLNHDQALAYYKEALKDYGDIKFRNGKKRPILKTTGIVSGIL